MKKVKKKYIVFLIVAGLGIAVNMAASSFSSAYVPMLYLDSIGTVLAAALCGYIPGIIVGFATNLLKGFTDLSSIYFSILNVLIAVAAAYMSRKNMFRRFPHILLGIVIFTFIGGVLGSVLTWFLNGGVPANGISFIDQIAGDTLNDLIDKTITVALTAVILRLLPKKVHEICNIDDWRNEDGSLRAPEGFRSLNTRIVTAVTIATVLVAIAISVISIRDYHKSMIGEQASFATDLTNYAASFIDPDRVDDYIKYGEKADGYAETEEKLKGLWECSENVEFIYAYRIEEDGCHVVFDLDTPEVEGGNPGDIVPFDESFAGYIPALLEGREIQPLVSNDTYGWLLTVYRPVYDAEGECKCYMAIDISMPKLMQNECIFITQLISLFLGFYVLILSVAIYLAKNYITRPINRMAIATSEFAYNSEDAYENSVERLQALNIRTGDEIENLYQATSKTVSDTASYINQISEQGEAIARLQNGLIMVMADMVEKRDQSTGDHIKNTAAYCRIITDQMMKEGIYSDVLTPEYASDIVLSAPLHDIGKIKVSDTILNKPGKLTDEEYEIMKKHTEYGSEIIGDAIEMLGESDSGYLREAKSLTLCHHEKWDGSGYPNGLKGEEIPLSARVMAVADVFDALVSKRVYKDAMPFEKVVGIIREESGRHFDPEVVRAFLDAEDEIRLVAENRGD